MREIVENIIKNGRAKIDAETYVEGNIFDKTYLILLKSKDSDIYKFIVYIERNNNENFNVSDGK
jgi:hypothetical protein